MVTIITLKMASIFKEHRMKRHNLPRVIRGGPIKQNIRGNFEMAKSRLKVFSDDLTAQSMRLTSKIILYTVLVH
jgi:hypothetical protein